MSPRLEFQRDKRPILGRPLGKTGFGMRQKSLTSLAPWRPRCLVLVCRTDKRSATAARLLREAGFAHVAVLRSGMEQWNEERLPVEAATNGD
jgi:Rhodanese-like domain